MARKARMQLRLNCLACRSRGERHAFRHEMEAEDYLRQRDSLHVPCPFCGQPVKFELQRPMGGESPRGDSEAASNRPAGTAAEPTARPAAPAVGAASEPAAAQPKKYDWVLVDIESRSIDMPAPAQPVADPSAPLSPYSPGPAGPKRKPLPNWLQWTLLIFGIIVGYVLIMIVVLVFSGVRPRNKEQRPGSDIEKAGATTPAPTPANPNAGEP